jgi:spermidine/putrescine transport system permease protein
VRAAGSRRAQQLLLLGPALTWWAVLLVVPVALVLVYSFIQRGTYGGLVWTFTLDNYGRALDGLYLDVLWSSIRIAGITTILALVLAFPVATFIATRRSPRVRTALLVLCVLPFWTSLLIRTYAWIVLLNENGLINDTLVSLGILGAPAKLLYNEEAIIVGLLYGYLPLMILPLYAAIERLDPAMREAATDLGAGPVRRFFTVTVPLTRSGIVAGCIFVFVPSLGNFIVPDLLGGGTSSMVGNLIQNEFLRTRDWPFGATIALAVILVMVIVISAQAWLLNRDRKEGVGAS